MVCVEKRRGRGYWAVWNVSEIHNLLICNLADCVTETTVLEYVKDRSCIFSWLVISGGTDSNVVLRVTSPAQRELWAQQSYVCKPLKCSQMSNT